MYDEVSKVLKEVKQMKKHGYNVYDSDVYLDDILRYISKEPTVWRDRNNGVCDSPSSYFAITPNGEMAVCCDWRTKNKYPVQDINFPKRYSRKEMFPEILEIARKCSGCMYGSYPEITTSIRFFGAALERYKIFVNEARTKITPHTPEELIAIAQGLIDND
jgi:hypothetical protein